MHLKVLHWLFLTATTVSQITSGYKILGLFPYNGRSHFLMFQNLMEGLAKRGHEVHVLSHYPRKTPLQNYTDLSLRGSMPLPNNQVPLKEFDYVKYDVFSLRDHYSYYSFICKHESVMQAEETKKLMTSDERYDLIITEAFATDMMLGFVHKFKVPFIFVSSLRGMPWTQDLMANPQNPAFVPDFRSSVGPKMTFFERVLNTAGLLLNIVLFYGVWAPKSQQITNKYFGEDTPPLLDIARNVSLMFINSNLALSGGRPYAPTVIHVGGIHIKPPKKLPQDIETFIENSAHGVIYFSMGSLLRTASLSEKKRVTFLDAFSKLKERILWKFEDESIVKSDNVMVKEWMPQRDILAHPKVKLFIFHGGWASMLEGVSEGKPMVGVPLFADQHSNVLALQSEGVATYVHYDRIDNETILEAIREMLKPEYAENAKQLSKLFHDSPLSPMDTAAYWVEYVIRNKGAKNLRSVAVDLPFYQYLLLDVSAFFVLCSIVSAFLIYYILNMVVGRRTVSKRVKKKMN